MLTLEFSGRRALLLGGSCTLALELAGLMITAGLRPVLTYRRGQGRRLIEEYFAGRAETIELAHLDVASETSVADFIHQMDQPPDYLVDFVHPDFEALVASADSSSVRDYFNTQVGLRSTVIQAVTRQMLTRKRGRLVFISSTAAQRPNAGQGFYAAAKQALEALYRNVGLELAGRGITTVTLRPGYINAGRGERYLEKGRGAVLKKVPLARALEPVEVANVIMFLLSCSATGFNATELTLDGGLSASK
ncbi:MAG: SDR family oxidoreductase [Desulfobacteraceae bacterium]|nr:SDR family oxidoreductase [Desulfobacteraceae bacterium]